MFRGYPPSPPPTPHLSYYILIARCWLLFIPYHFLTIFTKPPTYSRYSLTSLTQLTIYIYNIHIYILAAVA